MAPKTNNTFVTHNTESMKVGFLNKFKITLATGSGYGSTIANDYLSLKKEL